jgi:superkiller protein 3
VQVNLKYIKYLSILALMLLTLGFKSQAYTGTNNLPESEKLAEVERLINQGRRYHTTRNYILAIKAFETAYRIYPDNAQVKQDLSVALNNYGQWLTQRTDPHGGITQFRKALYFDETNEVARANLNKQIVAVKKIQPSDVAARISEGLQERQRSNFYAAIGELIETLKVKETSQAEVFIGKIYHVMGLRSLENKNQYLAKSMYYLDRAEAIDPASALPLVAKGDIYTSQGKISKGLEFYKKAIALEPDSPDAQKGLVEGWMAAVRVAPNIADNYVGLGTAYQLMNDVDNAETNFRRALQIDPRNRLATESLKDIGAKRLQIKKDQYLTTAVNLQNEERYGEAIRNYILAIRMDPRNPDIHYNIGTAFQAQKDWMQAEKAYRRALELKPDHGEAKIALDILNHDKGETRVKEAFERAIALHEQGQMEQAIKIYEKVAKDKPNDDTLMYNLGTAYQAMGKFDEAEKYYKKARAIKDDPQYAQATESLASKKVEKALADAIKAQSSGDNAKAIEKYKEVIGYNPDNANAWYNLGIAYQSLEDADQALNAYTHAFDIDARGQADAIFFAALIYEDKKENTRALNLYKQYLDVAPTGDYFMDARDRLEYLQSSN